jgi:hypothetical protein
LTTAAFRCQRGGAMFFPFYSAVFLAFESGNVICLRMLKIMSGGSGSHDEVHLMMMEKMHAMFEASTSLIKRETAVTLSFTLLEKTVLRSPHAKPLHRCSQ